MGASEADSQRILSVYPDRGIPAVRLQEGNLLGLCPIYANLSENKPMFAKVWYNNMWYIFLYAI